MFKLKRNQVASLPVHSSILCCCAGLSIILVLIHKERRLVKVHLRLKKENTRLKTRIMSTPVAPPSEPEQALDENLTPSVTETAPPQADEETNTTPLPIDDTPLPADPEQPVQDASNDDLDENCNNQNDDDDEMTIITLDHDPEDDNHAAAMTWMEQNGPEMEQRRRNVLLRELQRVQRASFIHFILLCLIPTALLMIVVITVFGEEEYCGSEITTCYQEARSFINAFTTRCICDALDVNREG